MVDILSDMQRQVREICVYLHTEFVALVAARQRDNEEDSFMDLSEVLSLDVTESLEHIAAAVKELMSAKRDLKTCRETAVDQDERERYERALQKVESEVRNHIKVGTRQVEQQLKLHIEHLQQKIEDCDKGKAALTASYEKAMEDLRKDNATLSDLVKAKDKELSEARAASMRTTSDMRDSKANVSDSSYCERADKPKLAQDVKLLKHNSRREAARMVEMERKVGALEDQLKSVQAECGDKQKECDKWKKEFEVLHVTMRNKEFVGLAPLDDAKADYYKRRYEEKCCELLQLEGRLSSLSRSRKPSASILEVRRSVRKSPAREGSTRSPSPLPATLKRTRSSETREMYTQIVSTLVKGSARQRKAGDRSLSMERLRKEKPRPSSNMRYFSMIAQSSRK